MTKDIALSYFRAELLPRFRGGITWNVVGALFLQGSTFLTNIILANFFGRDVFGEFSIIQSTLLAVSTVGQVATGITATKYLAEFRYRDKKRAGRIMGLCSAMTLLTGVLALVFLFIGGSWLAREVLNAPQLINGIFIAAGFVLFSVMNGYQMGALAGLESYRTLARVGAIQGVFYITICSLGAWFFGLEGGLGGLVVSSCVRWLMFGMAVRREARAQGIHSNLNGFWEERSILFKFAFPAAISGLSTMPAIWLSNVFLVNQAGGFSQMGLYSAAFTLKTLVLIVPTLINNVGMSLLNNQLGLQNQESYKKVFWTNLGITFTVGLAGVIIIALFADTFLGLFGPEFKEAFPVLLILMVSGIFEAGALGAYQIIQSRGKMWFSLFFIALPRDFLMICLAYFLTPRFGAVGLGLSYGISWIVASIIIGVSVYFMGLNLSENRIARVAHGSG